MDKLPEHKNTMPSRLDLGFTERTFELAEEMAFDDTPLRYDENGHLPLTPTRRNKPRLLSEFEQLVEEFRFGYSWWRNQ